MFDQLVSEKTARKPFAMAVSVSGQAVVLGLAILVPLLHTQAVTTGKLIQVVPMKRWGDPAPRKPITGRATTRAGVRIFSDHAFREPSRIPERVPMLDDGPVVAASAGPSGPIGVPDGIVDAVALDGPPPPKPAPAQQVTLQRAPSAVPPRVKVGGMVQAAKIVRQVRPIYPPLARQARMSGDVLLEAVISRDGTIESLRVINGHPLLVNAAVDAVRQWIYQPTLLNGEPVEVLTQIEVHFKLGE